MTSPHPHFLQSPSTLTHVPLHYFQAGPVGPEKFPGGEDDQRYKKQQFLDPDGICQVHGRLTRSLKNSNRCTADGGKYNLQFHDFPRPSFYPSKYSRCYIYFPTYCSVFITSRHLLKVGEALEPNHVIVNKFSPVDQGTVSDSMLKSATEQEYKHTKTTYKGVTPSIVDKVLITSNEHEHQIIKVRVLARNSLPT